jgi:tRNA threonylcarbamoyladenosine biosynthesis protein TsaE
MGIDETVQSPSFTISRVYDAPTGVRLSHYDFYRLHDAGIMADELHETLHDQKTVTIIEWADIVDGVLPADHIKIFISAPSESERRVEVVAGGTNSQALIARLA